ncbi:MAG: hypothetical protein AAB676_05750 [Verrucomicrobiota bacterium]
MGCYLPQAFLTAMQLTRASLSPHLLILALSVAVTLSVRTALEPRYAVERRRIEAEARTKRIREMAARWNSLTYTNIATPELSAAFLSKLQSQKLSLTAVQKEHLRKRVPEIFSYLQNPTVEAYLRLKTKALRYTFELSADAKRLARQAGLSPTALAVLDADTAVRQLWNRLLITNVHRVTSTSAVTAVCLQPIRAALAHTNSPGSVFNGPVRLGFTAARRAADPGFRYGACDLSTTNNASPGPFLLLSFFVRSNSSTNAGPVYLSLFWSEVHQNWAANRMFTDELLNFSPFF